MAAALAPVSPRIPLAAVDLAGCVIAGSGLETVSVLAWLAAGFGTGTFRLES
jgi:hypothetical protein